MKIKVSYTVELERIHILFAVVAGVRSLNAAKRYLREQMEVFGNDEYSFMGESFFEDLDYNEENYGPKVDKMLKGRM